jgi:murein DD-endopeptidase MepM/ murein hydrolase activator NlpD
MANDNKISKFRFALIDDTSHKHLLVIRFSRLSLALTILSAAIIVCGLIFSAIAFTPIKTFIPGYPDAHSKRAAIQNAIKVDSLENEIFRWEMYSENLRRVLSGEDVVNLDSLVASIRNQSQEQLQEAQLRKQDSLMRQIVKDEEQFGISARNHRELPIEGVMFFTPLKGAVSEEYDQYIHPAIDITAPAGSVVKAVLDGTVIYSDWNNDTGYTLYIQHDGDIISAYKHNSRLLKSAGDKVTAGSPIAIIGNTGELTTGTHLHFELWHKGNTVNPTKFINF